MIAALWQRFSQLGIHQAQGRDLRKRVEVTNQVCMSLFLICVPYIFIYHFLGLTWLGNLVIPVAGGYLFFMYLNHRGLYWSSRLLMITHGNLSVFLYAVALGKPAGIQMIFFGTCILPFVLFHPKNSLALLYSVSLPLLFHGILEATHYLPLYAIDLSPSVQQWIYYSMIPTTLLILVIPMRALSIANHHRERELRGLKKQNDLILNSAGEGILGVNPEGNITFINSAGARTLGYEPHELVQKPFHASIYTSPMHTDSDLPSTSPIQATFSDGLSHHMENEFFLKKDGSRLAVEYTSTPIQGKRLELLGAVVVYKDMTEKREMQSQVIQSAKLASIGELAAGVAHEINNPLAIIKGQRDRMIKITQDRSEKMVALLEKQDHAISRIQKIVSSLKCFSRASDEKTTRVDAHQVINDTLDMIQKIYAKEEVVFEQSFDATQSWVNGNAVKLQQILTNLIANARDAIQNNDRKLIAISTSNRGEDVEIGIRDNGCGIPDRHRERIFETFFTTKPTGKGTGLGLGICQSLLHSMGGSMSYQTELAQGSTFTILLPPAQNAKESEEKNKEDEKEENSDSSPLAA